MYLLSKDIQSMAFFMQKIMEKKSDYEEKMDELMEVLSEGPCLRIRRPIVQKFNIKVATIFACLESQYEIAIKKGETIDFDFKGIGVRNTFCVNIIGIITDSFYEFNKREVWAAIKKLADVKLLYLHNSDGNTYVFFDLDSVKDFQEFPKK